MPAAKVATTIEEQLLKRIDRLVAQREFPDRSQAIQEAVRDELGASTADDWRGSAPS